MAAPHPLSTRAGLEPSSPGSPPRGPGHPSRRARPGAPSRDRARTRDSARTRDRIRARGVRTRRAGALAWGTALAGALAGAACQEAPLVLRDEVIETPWARTLGRPLAGEPAPVLFLNRCVGGCTIRPAERDDARFDLSSIVSSTITLPPFPHPDDMWVETVRCVKEKFAPFELVVTDVDPGDAPHFENYVAGRPREAGFDPSVAGVASFNCGVIDNAVSFTFAGVIGEAEAMCVVVAHEAGHNFGLQHEVVCNDPMTYLPECGEREFQRADAPCGELDERECACGLPFQNTYLSLLASFGPRRTPIGLAPLVEIVDPAADGDRVEERFVVLVAAEDDRAIREVELFIDGTLAGTSTLAPFAFRAPPGLALGPHTLLAQGFDDEGLSDTSTRTVIVERAPALPPLRDGGVVDAEDPPIGPGPRDGGGPDLGPRGPDPLAEDGCGCTAAPRPPRATRTPPSDLGVAALLLATLALRRRRRTPDAPPGRSGTRSVARRWSARCAALLLLGACTGEDQLSSSGAHLVLSPPPGTPLWLGAVVLDKGEVGPAFVHATSLGPGTVRFDPRPYIEGPGAEAFVVSSAPRTLPPSVTRDIGVRFQPVTTGTKTAELVIRTNDLALPEARYPLSGYAREACKLVMTPPRQRIEVGSTAVVSLRATSSHRCVITRITTDFTLFDLVDLPELPWVIEPGATFDVRVKHTQRTREPGVPIRHVTARESDGSEVFVSIEGQPAAFNCISALPPILELPDGPLGAPVRGRVLVTNRCDDRVHVLAAYVTLGWSHYSVDPSSIVPFGVDPFSFASLWVSYAPFTEAGDTGRLVLQTDDALRPELEVELRGKGELPRAYVPPSVDAGEVAYERPDAAGLSACLSDRTVPIFSAGAVDLTVRGLGLDPEGDLGFTLVGASIDGVEVDLARPTRVPPGRHLDVGVRFRPSRQSPAVHSTRLFVDHTAIDGAREVAISGRAAAPGAVADDFTMTGPKVDVLFVLDDSLSMVGPRAELQRNTGRFLDLAEGRGADYQLGVITADTRTSEAGWLQRCNTGGWFIHSSDGEASARRADLACRMHTRGRGRGLQSGSGAAMMAVERALAPTPSGFAPSANHGFVRDGARLAVIITSNDDDQSVEPIESAAGFLSAAKGGAARVTVHAIAGDPAHPCPFGPPWSQPGHRYHALTVATGGTFSDICAQDLGPAVESLADVIFRPDPTFEPSRRPAPGTLRVEVGGVPVLEDSANGFSYDPGSNTVTLHGPAVPPPGTPVRLTYDDRCDG